MQPKCTTEPLYVAIDIGKNVHCFGGYAGLGLQPLELPQTVLSNRSGYATFSAWLTGQIDSGSYSTIIVGLEPTGCYHEPWAYAIEHDYGAQVCLQFINPYQTKKRRQQRQLGRRRKTDALDVEAIAYCLRDGLGHPARLPHDLAFRFGVWAATFRRVHRERQGLRAGLLAQIDRLWPGALVNVNAFREAHANLPVPRPLVLSRPLERRTVQVLLTHAPNPYDWLQRSPNDIQDFFHQHGLPCGPVKAQRAYDLVHGAVLLPPDLAECLVQQLRRDWSRLQLLQQELDQCRREAEQLLPSSPAAVLATVPGISAFLAAAYLAYVSDVQRFEDADQIWCLAGFSPEQEQSGDGRRLGKITRRGNPGFRNILYNIGLNTSLRCPAIARAKARALQRGKSPVGAVIHAAHLANRLCFHLLRNQTPYDPERMR